MIKEDISVNTLSDITVFSKYAKYDVDLGRRETWKELVTRNKDMHIKKFPSLESDIEDAYSLVYTKKILPSMRSMQFGGKPIELNPSRIYNCAYLPIEDIDSFSETMFLLLGGTGVGYSVQRHHVERMPRIKGTSSRYKRFLIGDSIEGWADSIKVLFESYYLGESKPIFDYSDIRARGVPLVTSGGKAPGPAPLKLCLESLEKILSKKEIGSRLSTIECHDIQCYIGDAVLAGGIRRSALISLFSMDDEDMLRSKGNFEITDWKIIEEYDVAGKESGSIGDKGLYDLKLTVKEPGYGEVTKNLSCVSEDDLRSIRTTKVLPWYHFQPQRGRANNSAVVLRHRVTERDFSLLWRRIEESNAGEPGVYFSNDKEWGTNPCCEIALRPYQFCNLVEVNVSDVADQEDLNNRCYKASLIATLQASYTDFHYLRDIWKVNTERDALLGVGQTGIGSGACASLDLVASAKSVVDANINYSKIIGINPAARCTTVKPSGTSSLVLGVSSGIHAWHNDYYIRRMRIGRIETLCKYLEANNPELIELEYFNPDVDAIIKIPIKAPDGSILRTEPSHDLLRRVSRWNTEWVRPGHIDGQNCHNVSCTISVRDDEWEAVGAWLWDNKDSFNGLSVLPYSGGTYKQAPFEDISEETYKDMVGKLHDVDLSRVYEDNDNTTLTSEAACAGGQCEI